MSSLSSQDKRFIEQVSSIQAQQDISRVINDSVYSIQSNMRATWQHQEEQEEQDDQLIIKSIDEKIQSIHEKIKSLTTKIEDLKQSLKKQKLEYEKKINQVGQQLQSKIQQINRLTSLLKDSERLQPVQEINRQFVIKLFEHMGKENIFLDLENYKHSITTILSNFKLYFNQVKYFAGSEVIQKNKVTFIVEEITKFTQKNIDQCKLLYRYDPRNAYFLKYVIGKQDLVVFVKLKNGFVVGGYSCTPVQKKKQIPKKIDKGKGLLFSVTNNLAFRMKKDPKFPIVSDVAFENSHFNFGNHEIRFKAKENQLFSNFGQPRSTFDSLGAKKTAFLGQAVNEIELLSFEFYQLKFR